MVYRFLNETSDRAKLLNLITYIEDTEEECKWWLPITSVCKEHNMDADWVIFVGAFSHGKLVGFSGLLLDSYYWSETVLALDLPTDLPTAEIGYCYVQPCYRGNNIMLSMNTLLLEKAKISGIRRIVSTVYTKDVYGRGSLEKLGMNYIDTVVKNTQRDVYMLEVK